MSVTDPTEPVERPRPTGGVDWAKDDHAVAVVAPNGEQILRFSVTHDAAGLPRLSPFTVGAANFYSWALVAAVGLAILTGFGRTEAAASRG